MLFKIKQLHGIKKDSEMVWDAANDKPLCEFIHGEFETEDEEVIAKLEALGYVGLGEDDVLPEEEPEEVSAEKILREKAKELGIKSYHLKSVETLTKEVAKLEGE
jgi:hypothetical protein